MLLLISGDFYLRQSILIRTISLTYRQVYIDKHILRVENSEWEALMSVQPSGIMTIAGFYSNLKGIDQSYLSLQKII